MLNKLVPSIRLSDDSYTGKIVDRIKNILLYK